MRRLGRWLGDQAVIGIAEQVVEARFQLPRFRLRDDFFQTLVQRMAGFRRMRQYVAQLVQRFDQLRLVRRQFAGGEALQHLAHALDRKVEQVVLGGVQVRRRRLQLLQRGFQRIGQLAQRLEAHRTGGAGQGVHRLQPFRIDRTLFVAPFAKIARQQADQFIGLRHVDVVQRQRDRQATDELHIVFGRQLWRGRRGGAREINDVGGTRCRFHLVHRGQIQFGGRCRFQRVEQGQLGAWGDWQVQVGEIDFGHGQRIGAGFLDARQVEVECGVGLGRHAGNNDFLDGGGRFGDRFHGRRRDSGRRFGGGRRNGGRALEGAAILHARGGIDDRLLLARRRTGAGQFVDPDRHFLAGVAEQAEQVLIGAALFRQPHVHHLFDRMAGIAEAVQAHHAAAALQRVERAAQHGQRIQAGDFCVRACQGFAHEGQHFLGFADEDFQQFGFDLLVAGGAGFGHGRGQHRLGCRFRLRQCFFQHRDRFGTGDLLEWNRTEGAVLRVEGEALARTIRILGQHVDEEAQRADVLRDFVQ